MASTSYALGSAAGVDFASIASTSQLVAQRGVVPPDPPGYTRTAQADALTSSKRKDKGAVTARKAPTPEEVEALRQKRAWDVAIAPAKSVPMNAFMLYMSGSGVQIFSMMVVGMLLTNPIKAIMTTQTSFAPYATPGKPTALLLQQGAFIACQLACMGLGIYKCWSMGLLPTASSDWLAWREPRTPIEFSPVYPS